VPLMPSTGMSKFFHSAPLSWSRSKGFASMVDVPAAARCAMRHDPERPDEGIVDVGPNQLIVVRAVEPSGLASAAFAGQGLQIRVDPRNRRRAVRWPPRDPSLRLVVPVARIRVTDGRKSSA
jgi:hypothetical protein